MSTTPPHRPRLLRPDILVIALIVGVPLLLGAIWFWYLIFIVHFYILPPIPFH